MYRNRSEKFLALAGVKNPVINEGRYSTPIKRSKSRWDKIRRIRKEIEEMQSTFQSPSPPAGYHRAPCVMKQVRKSTLTPDLEVLLARNLVSTAEKSTQDLFDMRTDGKDDNPFLPSLVLDTTVLTKTPLTCSTSRPAVRSQPASIPLSPSVEKKVDEQTSHDLEVMPTSDIVSAADTSTQV
jgi:hypothetical protein